VGCWVSTKTNVELSWIFLLVVAAQQWRYHDHNANSGMLACCIYGNGGTLTDKKVNRNVDNKLAIQIFPDMQQNFVRRTYPCRRSNGLSC
jgi:hypothetical protein